MRKAATIILRVVATSVFLADSSVRILFAGWEMAADFMDAGVSKCERLLK